MAEPYIASERLYLTEDGSAVVLEGDERARFLLAAAGTEVPAAEVERLGLKERHKTAAAPAHSGAVEDKAQAPDEDKAAGRRTRG